VSGPQQQHPIIVATDASWDPRTGVAGVACTANGRLLADAVFSAANNVEAEAYGLQLAIRAAAERGFKRVVIHCDCSTVVRLVHGNEVRSSKRHRQPYQGMRNEIKAHGWKLRWRRRDRPSVGAAHRCARRALRETAQLALTI